MTTKLLQTALFAGAAIIMLLFLRLMYEMNSSVREMSVHMGAMSTDVREMNGSMQAMRDSMLRMERSIEGMGQAFSSGSEQFKQWNPAGMMQQVLPGGGQRTR